MTRSSQNVFAAEPPWPRRQGPHLLVAGRNRSHTGWAASENPVLSGRAEQFGARALADHRRGLQRTGRNPATETLPLACRAAARRSAGCAGGIEQGASGKNTPV